MSDKDFLKHIGKRVRMERMAQGLTAKQLAAKISVWKHCISDIELGKRNAGVLQYKRIAEALGMDLIDLMH